MTFWVFHAKTRQISKSQIYPARCNRLSKLCRIKLDQETEHLNLPICFKNRSQLSRTVLIIVYSGRVFSPYVP